MSYALITPVYNEEDRIESLINMICKQSILPELWVIGDNGSSDRTVEKAKMVAREIKWIIIIENGRLPTGGNHLNFSYNVKKSYDYLVEHLVSPVDFIGKIDADTEAPPLFFEILYKNIFNDERLGVISGECTQINNDRIEKVELLKDSMRDIRLYRVTAIEEIGGFPLADYSPDTIILESLKKKGWGLKIEKTTHYTLNRGNNIDGKNNSDIFKNIGHSQYYIGYPFVTIIIISMINCIQEKSIVPINSIISYCRDYSKGRTRYHDSQIVDYINKDKRIWKMLLRFVQPRS